MTASFFGPFPLNNEKLVLAIKNEQNSRVPENKPGCREMLMSYLSSRCSPVILSDVRYIGNLKIFLSASLLLSHLTYIEKLSIMSHISPSV